MPHPSRKYSPVKKVNSSLSAEMGFITVLITDVMFIVEKQLKE